MSCKKGGKTKKHIILAKLETGDSGNCAFCKRNINDETIYGKLYSIGDIQCHYFCVLLSCCLVQNGKDNEGLFGFLYPDIIAEIERSKKHKCSYCGREGATLGCSVTQCRKQFHLPCGRERDAVSLFFGNYKSFCQLHAPRQKINGEIMTKIRERTLAQKKTKVMRKETTVVQKETVLSESDKNLEDDQTQVAEIVCVICYEPVEACPTIKTFWPPCCARDAWFHRNCLQRMALSAGVHYLKCPLCNDKKIFLEAVMSQGYYVPDRDAAWELEQNAFSDMYERNFSCSAANCGCPMGRDHDSDTDNGSWNIKLCILCGSSGMHDKCLQAENCSGGNDGSNYQDGRRYVCIICAPAAPQDIDSLAAAIETVSVGVETQPVISQPVRRGPVMPCRMSLRRTKQRMALDRASSSNTVDLKRTETTKEVEEQNDTSDDIEPVRMDLNLKPPKAPLRVLIEPSVLKNIDNELISPLKLLEKGLYERINETEETGLKLDSTKLLDVMSEKFKKPKPLIEKKKIINDLIDNVLEDLKKDKTKAKESVKEWSSPKKYVEIEAEDIQIKGENTFDEAFRGFGSVDDNSPIKIEKEESKEVSNNSKEEEEKVAIKEIETKKIEDISENVPIFSTPKKLKPVHIQKDSSMEISENDQTVNIDVVKIDGSEPKSDVVKNLELKCPTNPRKCALKFNPNDQEELHADEMDIDIESFKNHYLNEVDRDAKCTSESKRVTNKDEVKLRAGVKRKTSEKESVTKRRKESRKLLSNNNKESNIEEGCSEINKSVENEKKTRKHRTKLSINNKKIEVKIRWKCEQLKLQITESSRRKKNNKKKQMMQKSIKLKQYVMKLSPEMTHHSLQRPEKEIVPKKRKNIKTEKSTDRLIQTSLYDFFKTKNDKKTTS